MRSRLDDVLTMVKREPIDPELVSHMGDEAALRKMRNVVLTPHLGSATVEVREEMANIVVDNILALIDGRRPPNCVNPEVLDG
jgi:phosphogluconate 2-dehydrogenase